MPLAPPRFRCSIACSTWKCLGLRRSTLMCLQRRKKAGCGIDTSSRSTWRIASWPSASSLFRTLQGLQASPSAPGASGERGTAARALASAMRVDAACAETVPAQHRGHTILGKREGRGGEGAGGRGQGDCERFWGVTGGRGEFSAHHQ